MEANSGTSFITGLIIVLGLGDVAEIGVTVKVVQVIQESRSDAKLFVSYRELRLYV